MMAVHLHAIDGVHYVTYADYLKLQQKLEEAEKNKPPAKGVDHLLKEDDDV